MDAKEGRQRLAEADTLYRAGQYEAALGRLAALHAAYPELKHVVQPVTMCLEQLGRTEEAMSLCRMLVSRFQDPHAKAMLQRLQPTVDKQHWEELEIAAAYPLPDLGPFTRVPVVVHEADGPSTTKITVCCCAAVVGLLFLLCLPYLLQRVGVLSPTEVPTTSSSPFSLLTLGLVLVNLVVFQVLGTGVAALALGVVKKLPSVSISGVLLDVGVTLLGANIVAAMVSILLTAVAPLAVLPTVFVVENIVMLAAFSYSYKFNVADAFVFASFFLIFLCVAAFVVGMMFGTGLGVAAIFLSGPLPGVGP